MGKGLQRERKRPHQAISAQVDTPEPDLPRPGQGHPEQAQQQTQKKTEIQNPQRGIFTAVMHFKVEFGISSPRNGQSPGADLFG
jgi:hypothetical protein